MTNTASEPLDVMLARLRRLNFVCADDHGEIVICDEGDEGAWAVAANPDGPQAHAAITALTEQLAEMTRERDALRDALSKAEKGYENMAKELSRYADNIERLEDALASGVKP